jgi:predicted restriction endonuclease
METLGATLTKVCRVCSEELVIGVNWNESQARQHRYFCRNHHNYLRASGLLGKEKILSSGIHKCNPFVDETPADLNNLPSQSRTVTKTVTVNERVNDQDYFRNQIALKLFNKCVVSGFDLVELCEAAHIIPVKGFNGPDKPGNCLLLVGGLHKAFDRFMYTILPCGTILVAPQYRESSLGVYHCKRVLVPLREDHREYLIWHNDRYLDINYPDFA